MNSDEMKAKLQAMLKPERYVHSLGVAQSCFDLAQKYGYDAQKAYLVGLLHDCAKNIPKQEQIGICHKNNIQLDEIELITNGLIHAKTGVAVARIEFGLTDPELLDAISYHATGRENMTLIEKIVYLADMIDPSRAFGNLEELRKEAYVDLNKALLMTMNLVLKFNIEKNSILHPTTLLARNYLLITMSERYKAKK
jgi:predicted HD superfamily hydrolase involved in NAD metabolism